MTSGRKPHPWLFVSVCLFDRYAENYVHLLFAKFEDRGAAPKRVLNVESPGCLYCLPYCSACECSAACQDA